MQFNLPFEADGDATPSLPPPLALRQTGQPGVDHRILFARHPRAKRYVIRVGADGTVHVTIPRWGSKREAVAFAQSESAWIEKQQARLTRGREGREGQEGQEGKAWPEPSRPLLARAKAELPPRLLELAAQFGLRVGKVSVRNQKWRWGSCSPGGHICLNWRLVCLPGDLRDYVLVHELMHLKRMDHSPKFWKLVEQACPDYRELRRRLRASYPS